MEDSQLERLNTAWKQYTDAHVRHKVNEVVDSCGEDLNPADKSAFKAFVAKNYSGINFGMVFENPSGTKPLQEMPPNVNRDVWAKVMAESDDDHAIMLDTMKQRCFCNISREFCLFNPNIYCSFVSEK
jgi:hypothetical protein